MLGDIASIWNYFKPVIHFAKFPRQYATWLFFCLFFNYGFFIETEQTQCWSETESYGLCCKPKQLQFAVEYINHTTRGWWISLVAQSAQIHSESKTDHAACASPKSRFLAENLIRNDSDFHNGGTGTRRPNAALTGAQESGSSDKQTEWLSAEPSNGAASSSCLRFVIRLRTGSSICFTHSLVDFTRCRPVTRMGTSKIFYYYIVDEWTSARIICVSVTYTVHVHYMHCFNK